MLRAPVVEQRAVQEVRHARQRIAQRASGLDELGRGRVVLSGPLVTAGVGAGHPAAGVDRIGERVHEVHDAAVGAGQLRDSIDVSGALDVDRVAHA